MPGAGCRRCPRPDRCRTAASPIASTCVRGMLFQDDPAFGLGEPGRTTREIRRRRRRLRADAHRRIRRWAAPWCQTFSKIRGFSEFGQRLHGAPRGRRGLLGAAHRRAVSEGGAGRGNPGGGRHRSRDRARRGLSAAALLVRHALHGAGALGGRGLLRRQGRTARLLPRPPDQHRPLPASPSTIASSAS